MSCVGCVRMLQANHVAIAGSILVGYCENDDGVHGHSRLLRRS